MRPCQGSAPGKVLLWGEYGVLKGAPALVMAINRRVEVTLNPSQRFSLLSAPPGDFEASVRTQLATLLDEHHIDPRRLDQLAVTIDSSALYQSSETANRKLGLGSSAAVLAALDAAVSAMREGERVCDPVARLAALQTLHQSGQGSGVDLAAAMLGGVLNYQREADGQIHCQPVSWPGALHWAVLWSGQPSSSADHVARFLRWCEAAPALAEGWIQRSAQCSQAGLAALIGADIEGVLAAFDEAAELMGTIGSSLGSALLTPIDIESRKIAQSFDLVYKPSGAGGGDIAVLLGQDAEAMTAAVQAMQALGLISLNLEIEHNGARARAHADLDQTGK